MKITVWVMTNRVGSKFEKTIEIDDEDADCAEEIAFDAAMYMVEWGWKKEDEEED